MPHEALYLEKLEDRNDELAEMRNNLKKEDMGKCNHLDCEIIAVTSFGHGGSTTKIHAKCKACGEIGLYVQERGFPATYKGMRKAQQTLYDKGE